MMYPRGTHDFTESSFPPDIPARDLPKPVVLHEFDPAKKSKRFILATLIGRAISSDMDLDGRPLIYFTNEEGQQVEVVITPRGSYTWADDGSSFDLAVGILPL